MIDKIQPRKLDKDTDQKLVQKTSMIDALNIYVDENLAGTEAGAGVLKPVLGTVGLAFTDGFSFGTDEEPSDVRILGSTVDDLTNVLYFYVWSSDATEQGVYAYDHDSVLSDDGGLRKIFTSEVFNFPPDGFVKGDVVYKRERGRADGTRLPDVDSILYFTDGVNEPRKLDIYRALFGSAYGDIPSMPEGSSYKIHDVLCACPKVPMGNIDFNFSADTEKEVSNFDGVPGVQFAMQGVYTDGSVTAIGPYSKIAFPSSLVNRGAAGASKVLNDNVCKIKIPEIQEDIETIKILYRYGNKASFRELAEVPNQQDNDYKDQNWDQALREYSFYNDQVSTGVSPSDVAKTFDNLPRQARAQSAISNRLVFSNFKDGFDPYKPEVSTTVLFKKRPAEGVDFTIDLLPTIETITGGPGTFGTVNNKAMGFEINTEEIPDNIPEDTTISIAFSFSPDKNFHVFEARGSFHQSQHVGPASGNFSGLELDHEPNGRWKSPYFDNGNTDVLCEDIVTQLASADGGSTGDALVQNSGLLIDPESAVAQLLGTGGGTEPWTPAFKAGQGSTKNNSGGGSYTRGLMWDQNEVEVEGQPNVNAAFGRNFGVGYRADVGQGAAYPYGGHPFDPDGAAIKESCRWDYTTDGGANYITRAAYGTSAAAPLIIQGTKLSFDLSFKITQEVSNGKEVVAQAIQDIMVSRPLTNPGQVEFISSNNVYNYSLDVGLTDGKKIFQSDPEKNLITMVTDVGEKGWPNGSKQMTESLDNINQVTAENIGSSTGYNRRLPAGYFILNKADVKFFFEPESRGPNGTSTPGIKAFHLSIADVVPDAEDGIYTCVKRSEPMAPWRAYSKAGIKSRTETSLVDLHNHYNDGIPEDDKYLNRDAFSMKVESLETTNWYWANAKAGGYIRCNENDPSIGEAFWPCKIDVDNEDYQPHDPSDNGFSVSRYRFSLLDGAGGPGGNPAGAQSAYGRYENNRFGSVASQMIATFYGVHDTPVRGQLRNAVPSIGYAYDDDYNWSNGGQGVLDVGVIGGVFKEINDGINDSNDEAALGSISEGYAFGDPSSGPVITRTTSRVTQSKIPTKQHIKDRYPASGFPGVDEIAHVVYVLAGPFFTGSIAMNPIASAGNGNDGGLKSRQSGSGGALGQKALRGVWDGSYGVGTKRDYRFINGNLCPINEDQQWTPRGVWDQTTTMPYIFSGSTSPKVHQDQITYRSVFPWPVVVANNIEAEENTIDQVNVALFSNLYGSEGGEGFDPSHPPFGSISWADKPGHAEMAGPPRTSVSGASSKPIMSFKANANHEFGVIYYDERGRHGRVNHIGSVYVPGFSSAERNGVTDGGPAHIRINFRDPAPDWAHYYKIAYSKNTSVSKFFQYSAGGAFITQNENPIDSGLNSAKIYVSLNYLQGHPISYSDSWGGRSQEGSPIVYQPKEGDKVRVISHQRSSESQLEKVFVKNIVFDVIGVESLGGNFEENPLWADPDEDVPENRKGLFLTIKNNPENTGFSYADIEQDNHLWGHNCIIEIFRPVSDLGAEDRLYFEIGPTYRCASPGLGDTNFHLNHKNENQPIEVVDGDVFFRKTAVNLREFEEGEFIDLIRLENVDINQDGEVGDEWVVSSEPNFKSVYTEAMAATDLFKSDNISIGRPNKIDNNEKEMMRIASLVHSDKDITKSSKVGYSSFNETESNDKDLDVAHGEVDYIANTDDSLLIIQKNKVGHVPVDRNLISTADNEPSLISSSKFLGTARYYAGRGGSDGHPESIAMANGNAYFAHKTDGKVFRASGANGLLEISNKGMKTFFRNLFSSMGKNDKIAGGYDPIKEEYLINVQVVEEPTPQNGVLITQQDTPLLTFNTEFLENSTDTSGQFSGGGIQDTTEEEADEGGPGGPGGA